MKNTSQEYDKVIGICRDLFSKKMTDYGSAWRILRLPSLTDQIFIKAQRIRSLQENEVRKVDEDETGEFIGADREAMPVAHGTGAVGEVERIYRLLERNAPCDHGRTGRIGAGPCRKAGRQRHIQQFLLKGRGHRNAQDYVKLLIPQQDVFHISKHPM